MIHEQLILKDLTEYTWKKVGTHGMLYSPSITRATGRAWSQFVRDKNNSAKMWGCFDQIDNSYNWVEAAASVYIILAEAPWPHPCKRTF